MAQAPTHMRCLLKMDENACVKTHVHTTKFADLGRLKGELATMLRTHSKRAAEKSRGLRHQPTNGSLAKRPPTNTSPTTWVARKFGHKWEARMGTTIGALSTKPLYIGTWPMSKLWAPAPDDRTDQGGLSTFRHAANLVPQVT